MVEVEMELLRVEVVEHVVLEQVQILYLVDLEEMEY